MAEYQPEAAETVSSPILTLVWLQMCKDFFERPEGKG